MLENRDAEAAREQILDLQDMLAETTYQVSIPHGAVGDFTGLAPDLRNGVEYQVLGCGQGYEVHAYYWRDA